MAHDIRVLTTDEVNAELIQQYHTAFEASFSATLPSQYFKSKYSSTELGYSYHSFLFSKNILVGSVTAIPFKYCYRNKTHLLALAVGVFIHPDHRDDPFALMKVYRKLKKRLASDEIEGVLAVPNATSFTYWTKVVKWQVIGDLPYYSLPLRPGAVLGQPTLLDPVASLIISQTAKLAAGILGYSSSRNPLPQVVSLCVNKDIWESHRYVGKYNHVAVSLSSKAHYTVVSEGGIKTAYLIDFRNQSWQRTRKAYLDSIKYLLSLDIDLLLYIGRLAFPANPLIKVPRSKEPKRLPLTIDYLSLPNATGLPQAKDGISAWDFGLLNYDAR